MISLFPRHPVTHPEKIHLDPQNCQSNTEPQEVCGCFFGGKRSMPMKHQQRKKTGGDGTIILKMAKPF